MCLVVSCFANQQKDSSRFYISGTYELFNSGTRTDLALNILLGGSIHYRVLNKKVSLYIGMGVSHRGRGFTSSRISLIANYQIANSGFNAFGALEIPFHHIRYYTYYNDQYIEESKRLVPYGILFATKLGVSYTWKHLVFEVHGMGFLGKYNRFEFPYDTGLKTKEFNPGVGIGVGYLF